MTNGAFSPEDVISELRGSKRYVLTEKEGTLDDEGCVRSRLSMAFRSSDAQNVTF